MKIKWYDVMTIKRGWELTPRDPKSLTWDSRCWLLYKDCTSPFTGPFHNLDDAIRFAERITEQTASRIFEEIVLDGQG